MIDGSFFFPMSDLWSSLDNSLDHEKISPKINQINPEQQTKKAYEIKNHVQKKIHYSHVLVSKIDKLTQIQQKSIPVPHKKEFHNKRNVIFF